MAACRGDRDDHCCYLFGVVCPFLEESADPAATGGRRWWCALRRRLGSWEAVRRHPDYLVHVAPVMLAMGAGDCADWPPPGVTCGTCGVKG